MSTFEWLSDFKTLRRSAFRARKGTKLNPEIAVFWGDLERNLIILQAELRTKSYQPRPFRCFAIRDPKPRRIQAAHFRDRVVHHALCSVLDPLFEENAIVHSYACRKGKGTHAALLYAQYCCRRWSFFSVVDILHCFETLSHPVLMGLLQTLNIDAPTFQLCLTILQHGQSTQDRGLPIGNLSSQHFANATLTLVDRAFITAFPDFGYLRYMDDILIFTPTAKAALSAQQETCLFIHTKLNQKPKYDALRRGPVSNGVPYLGFRIWPHHMRLDQARKKRLRRHLKRVSTPKSIQARLSWAHHSNSHRLTTHFFP